jgi:YVTN family beta-propeller protein
LTTKNLFAGCLFLAVAVHAQQPAKKHTPPPGVSTPGVKRELSTITPVAIFDTVSGSPDWQVLTEDAVWVTNSPRNVVHRLDVNTNKIAATIEVGKHPCSGLAAGFGAIWVPNCGDKTISRIDIATNSVVATVPVGPGESEGGIAASKDAIWLVTDPKGVLSRIDPKTNTVLAAIDVPAGSAAVLYGDGAIWVTTPTQNMLTRVDAITNKVTDSIMVGPGARFETFGGGSVWTLNQGDGTISRVDTQNRKVTATIEWVGEGGDSIRAGHGSIWLSNLRAHNIWRIDPTQF